MAVNLIAYDLNEPGQSYDAVISTIKKSYPTRWHCQKSVWLVATTEDPDETARCLLAVMDDSDKLFVTRVPRDAAWSAYSDAVTNWLGKHL